MKASDNKNNPVVMRKSWGAQINVDLIDELKHLSVDLNTPVYLLVEEALQNFIKTKKKLLAKRSKK